ncbi:Uncharacterized membrane protein, DUF106 family [Halogranum gelatinilyticum]|uniref:Uncharacterized membrane protein, DUF106 family n=1 Tax=Halogranum gelatinilyticum TaxID=660521 RepID=A0A1G9TI73_9EURY|nr:DUF106 domain-containing protein [Halogranum gelatinilyticum]SDM47194.1 Uncharacterized membrane protein, DUF106 family [Halogranum gelatinilyticum]
MARIEAKVRSLVSDDPEMRGAIETVLDRSEDGEIKWVDVKNDLSSGQWGRLIEKGVLVDGDEGFALADVDATREGLEEKSDDGSSSSGSSGVDDVEGTSWSKYDKGAALVTVGLFAGYSLTEVRNVIGGVMDIILGPLAEVLPFYAVVMVLALGTGLYSTLLQANLMNMDKMGAYQERMKDIQERRKEAKEAGDDAALEQIQEEQMEAMGDQMGMFKEQFRPMVWIMFLTIPVFLWMYWAIGIGGNPVHVDLGNLVLPLAGEVTWKEGILGPMQTWIVWYFLCSMAFTQVIRKGLNISTTPSTS